MKITKTKTLTEVQHTQINQLWNEEFPLNLNNRFGLLLNGVEHHNHYFIEKDGNIIAWAVLFEKENEIRFSIIVSAKHKGKGLGLALIKKLKEENSELHGWVIDHNNDKKADGENYPSPLPFYIKQGFEILNNQRIDNEMLKAVKIKWKKKQPQLTQRFNASIALQIVFLSYEYIHTCTT